MPAWMTESRSLIMRLPRGEPLGPHEVRVRLRQRLANLGRAVTDELIDELEAWVGGVAEAIPIAVKASALCAATEVAPRYASDPDALLALDPAGARLAGVTHRALRGLDDGSRHALRVACVFAGGFELDDGVASPVDLEGLRQVGWLIRDGDRLFIPEPVRHIVLQTLSQTELREARIEHARCVLRLQTARPVELEGIVDRGPKAVTPELAAQAALRLIERARFSSKPLPPRALRMLAYGRRASDVDGSLALAVAARLIDEGAFEDAHVWLRQAERLAKPIDERARAAIYEGHVYVWQGDFDHAREALDRAASFPRLEPDHPDVFITLLTQRAFLALRSGEDTTEALDAAARFCIAHGFQREQAIVHHLRGRDELRTAGCDIDRLELARSWFQRSQHGFAAAGDARGACINEAFIVSVWRRLGELARARELALSALTRVHEINSEAHELFLLLELQLLGHDVSTLRERATELTARTQIRALRRLAGHALGDDAVPELALDVRGECAILDGQPIDLSRHEAPRRLLAALCARGIDDPGMLSAETLFRVGWPGQRIARRSQLKRVQTAVWTLRRMGFGQRIEASTEGYCLPAVVRWQSLEEAV